MFGMSEKPILQDLLGAQRIAAVDQSDVMTVVGHVERFLDRGIAAADHDHLLAAVEEAVAGRAGGDPLPLQQLLGRQVQPARLRAGRDHERVAEIEVPPSPIRRNGRCGKVDLDDMVPHHLRADMLGLLLHLLHQPGALDDVGEAGIILDVGGDGELPAGLDALDDDRRHAGAGGIDGGGEAGRAGAEDEHAGGMGGGHEIRGVKGDGSPRLRNRAFAAIGQPLVKRADAQSPCRSRT